MLHHFALFTPILYAIFGEILPSRTRKMRFKWRTLFIFCASVGLIALYGYSQRHNTGGDARKEPMIEAKMAAQAQGGGAGVLVADNFVKEPRHSRRNLKPNPGRDEAKPLGADTVKGKHEKTLNDGEEKIEAAASSQKRKVFPDPISLKPQTGKEGKAPPPQQPAQEPRPQPPVVKQPPPQPKVPAPAVNQPNPQAPAVRQPHPQANKVLQQPQVNIQQPQQVRDQLKQSLQSQHALPGNHANQADAPKKEASSSVINLSVVCCGDRTDETLVMLKSATILAKQTLHFHIFAEDELQAGIAQRLNSWPAVYRQKIVFNLYPISFPPGEDPEKWKKVFKTCATQRLFIPDLLQHVDSLLYVDTDILFIRPIDEIYSFFKKFNSTHMAALAPEHEVKNIGWYNRFARHPYYGETGMNSGVMLMNLTRMRAFGWTQKVVPYYHEYKLKITWGDQDLINILFHYYPEGLFKYECEWNYRPDHCMYSNNCHRIKDHGIAVIHGCRGVYHSDKQPAFKAIYESFKDYTFGANLERGLIQPLKDRLTKPDLQNNYCAKAVLEPVSSTLKRFADQVIPIKGPV